MIDALALVFDVYGDQRISVHLQKIISWKVNIRVHVRFHVVERFKWKKAFEIVLKLVFHENMKEEKCAKEK